MPSAPPHRNEQLSAGTGAPKAARQVPWDVCSQKSPTALQPSAVDGQGCVYINGTETPGASISFPSRHLASWFCSFVKQEPCPLTLFCVSSPCLTAVNILNHAYVLFLLSLYMWLLLYIMYSIVHFHSRRSDSTPYVCNIYSICVHTFIYTYIVSL